jgi:hypothetical protein
MIICRGRLSCRRVRARRGLPDKIVDLGAKQIYVYRDMKVVFLNNVVADIQ